MVGKKSITVDCDLRLKKKDFMNISKIPYPLNSTKKIPKECTHFFTHDKDLDISES